MIEIEATFLDVRHDDLRRILTKKGASKVFPKTLMKRKLFDYNDFRLQKDRSWVRLRKEGDKVTLAFKQQVNKTIEGQVDVEVVVSEFERMSEILTLIGMTEKSYQESKRERWQLNGVNIDLDQWPWLPEYVEIEGASKEAVEETSKLIGFNWEDAFIGSVDDVYCEYYDIEDFSISSMKQLTFDMDTPESLSTRLKNK